MGSGLIFIVIVAVWAAYLIPMWLRRHDELSAAGSAERLARTSRLLRRRPAASSGRTVVAPVRRAARRRAKVLVVLTLLVGGLGVGAGFGALAVWAPLSAAGLLLAYLVQLRLALRRARVARAAARRRAASRRRRELLAQPTERVGPASAPAPPIAVEPEDASQLAAADEVRDGGSPGLGAPWQPVPVPLPTYVTKPKAAQPARVIELSLPGAWYEAVRGSRAASVAEALAEASAGPASAPGEAVVPPVEDVAPDARRAVND